MRNPHALSILAGIFLSFAAYGQTTLSAYNNNPAIRTTTSDKMYQKTIWRTVDLREKQNKPLFASNRQISKVIIEAVRKGELPIYKNDSLTSKLTKEQFLANMTLLSEQEELTPEQIEMGFQQQDEELWPGMEATANNVQGPAEFLPSEMYLLEIKENAVFDKKRSRMYYEIESLSLIVPASLKTNLRQRDFTVGTFKYDDLMKVFRMHKAEARWVNPHNDAEQKNLADALELRLFSSYITKVSNPDNLSLEDLHKGPMQGLWASRQTADKLLEYEYNLWSF
ncbi:gliding motility protein GldN [Adhaeribacter terreus]|uniref:Gliding motility protein GldN n=1 Tax=Adhaeribacter terreus TaxID=529703 RepID=A0ABW0E8L6_9BACT